MSNDTPWKKPIPTPGKLKIPGKLQSLQEKQEKLKPPIPVKRKEVKPQSPSAPAKEETNSIPAKPSVEAKKETKLVSALKQPKPVEQKAKTAEAVVKKEPLVEKKGAAVLKKEPSILKKESKVEKKEPTPIKKEPTVAKREPSAVKKEPKVGKKETVVEKKEPTVEKKEIVAEKQEPPVEKKETIVEKKEPTVVKEEPVVEKKEEPTPVDSTPSEKRRPLKPIKPKEDKKDTRDLGKMSSRKTKGKTTKKRAQRATSNVFAMFDQAQIQEFKEAFNMIDQNRDGFIDKEDLGDMLASLGKNPTDEYLEAMMNEAPGPINFTMFLTMFGEKLNGTDPEDVIKNAFGCFDEEGTGYIPEDRLRELLTTMGDRFSEDDVDEMFREAPIKNGNFFYIDFTKILKHGKKDEDDQ